MKQPDTKADILNMTQAEFTAWLANHHLEPYRSGQIFKWLFIRRADTFDSMTDLSKKLRQYLNDYFYISRLNIAAVETSTDGTQKILFGLQDGKYIESVLIPEKKHYTLCISTQAGCSSGCAFCRTAGIGFERNLTQAEILLQVIQALSMIADPSLLTNIVFMGMGEPLANYDNVINALNIITDHDRGLKFAQRRVTVSTCGIVPQIYALGHDSSVSLAVSLNAADDETRSQLMPINRKYGLNSLIEACRNYPLKPHRRITIEYILLKGINDSVQDARNLARLLRPLRVKINLIPFNPHDQSPFSRPDSTTIEQFQQILLSKHYTVIIRTSKGQDIAAACGQLRGKHEPLNHNPSTKP